MTAFQPMHTCPNCEIRVTSWCGHCGWDPYQREEPTAPDVRARIPSLPDDRSEKEIEAEVIKHLEGLGWLVLKTSQPQKPVGMTPGLPDLIVVGYDVTAFLEVKAADGVQSDDQQKVERGVLTNGGIYRIVRSEAEAVEWAEQYMPGRVA